MVEESGKFAQVLSQHLFSSPISTGFIESLSDVSDVLMALLLRHLSKQNVEVFHDTNAHIRVIVPQEAVSDAH